MIGVLSIMWLHFQSFPLLHTGGEGYSETSTTSNSVNLMSSCELQHDGGNLAEKINECPLEQGLLSTVCVQLGP